MISDKLIRYLDESLIYEHPEILRGIIPKSLRKEVLSMERKIKRIVKRAKQSKK